MIYDIKKIIFLAPPKTGSSSLKSLFSSFELVQRPEFRRLDYPHYHLYISELGFVYGVDAKSFSNYNLIQVVRDPLKRFISAWKHQERILGQTIRVEELLDKLILYKSLLPKEWDEFYLEFYKNPNHKANSFQKGNWGGLRFYVDQVDWNDLNLEITYFKLEELSIDISPLSDFLKLSLPSLPQKNKGNYKESLGGSLTYSQKEKIYKLFEKDFKRFNYEF